MKERVSKHILATDNRDQLSPIWKQFSNCTDKGSKDLKVKIIEQFRAPLRGVDTWIFTINTTVPNGLNTRWEEHQPPGLVRFVKELIRLAKSNIYKLSNINAKTRIYNMPIPMLVTK